MLKLKRIKTGRYITQDNRYIVENYDGFWIAYDAETGQSVVDSEDKLRKIKESLESYIKHS